MTDVFAVFLQREDDAGDVTAAVDRAAADRQEAVRRPVRPGGRHAGRRRDRPTRCPGGARPLAPRGARPQTSHQRTLAGARSRTTQVHRRLTPVMLTIQTVARNSCTVYQFKLCLIVSVRRSLTRTTLLTLVHALVVTKVDYCSSVLSGIFGQLLQRLQSVFNAAARLVFSARTSEHITPLLRELHI